MNFLKQCFQKKISFGVALLFGSAMLLYGVSFGLHLYPLLEYRAVAALFFSFAALIITAIMGTLRWREQQIVERKKE